MMSHKIREFPVDRHFGGPYLLNIRCYVGFIWYINTYVIFTGRQVPIFFIFSYFSQHTPIFQQFSPIFPIF